MPDDLSVHRWPHPVSGEQASGDHRWPDDIIVDFPAMASVVERMQAAFFAGELDEPAVAAEIAITPRQAFAGERLPVHLPVRRNCPRCEGRGECADQVCGACAGTGHRVNVESVLVFVPAGVRDGARLRLRVAASPALSTSFDVRIRIR
ncbi:MAG: hypothetical protein AB7I50_11965 [Vicinamibacterales bacterium]